MPHLGQSLCLVNHNLLRASFGCSTDGLVLTGLVSVSFSPPFLSHDAYLILLRHLQVPFLFSSKWITLFIQVRPPFYSLREKASISFTVLLSVFSSPVATSRWNMRYEMEEKLPICSVHCRRLGLKLCSPGVCWRCPACCPYVYGRKHRHKEPGACFSLLISYCIGVFGIYEMLELGCGYLQVPFQLSTC